MILRTCMSAWIAPLCSVKLKYALLGWEEVQERQIPETSMNMDINNQPLTANQLPLIEIIDLTEGVSLSRDRRKRKVQKTRVIDMFAQVRQLHEQINCYLHKCPASERPSVNSPADAASLLMPFIGNIENEEMWILVLNRRNSVIQIVRLYQGSVNSSQVRVGEVFRVAILEQASAILLAHNHPSGDPNPSSDDISVTRAINQAGKLLDIDVLDHLILGQGNWVSLKTRGLGFA